MFSNGGGVTGYQAGTQINRTVKHNCSDHNLHCTWDDQSNVVGIYTPTDNSNILCSTLTIDKRHVMEGNHVLSCSLSNGKRNAITITVTNGRSLVQV